MSNTILRCAVAFLAIAAGSLSAAAGAQGGISSRALDATAPPATLAQLASAQPVAAKHAMVVTSQHLATEVGVRVLKAGGNAIDAAVAVGYALAVVEPCCGNIGGGGFMLIHLADGKAAFLDFREKAPAKATPTMMQDDQGTVVKGRSTDTYLSVGVPGTVLGLETARAKYGTMSRAQLMQPAIDLAREGYVLQQGDVNVLGSRTADFARTRNVAAIFLNDGKPWQVGERLRQPQLARTLELIRKEGPDAFYRGPIARTLVLDSIARGGILSMQDFANYDVRWDAPVRCDYRGYAVLSSPPPSSGGTTVCQILQIVEPYPLQQWGYGAAQSLHVFAEASRRAYADRNTYLGDPAFVTNPLAQLLAPAHAAALRRTIRDDRATPSSEIKGNLFADEGEHTTHYSIVDAQGNAVGVTYTINYLFGNALIAGDTGFFLNNEMDDFTAKPGVPNGFGLVQGTANQIEAGKRPLSSMAPTIVLDKGKPFMVTGSPGGSTIITTVAQSIVNVIAYGMNAQQAVDAPRLHMQWLPDQIMVEPGLLTPEVRAQLQALGHTIRDGKSWGADAAIVVDADGTLTGANDRRRPAGLAAGY
ncbi:gamma-glutamyltransferase [Solimonas soli]|uniref:gamma-glutamyltransferase n=1 Tax=Solimonas soli TaxID=413479 RepID=UPI0006857217|nr:gamma-glutamyltransferase [Solimonas soli]